MPWLLHEHQWDTCWACGHKHVKNTRSIIMVDGTLKKIQGDRIKPKKVKTNEDIWRSMIFRGANSNMTVNQMKGLFYRDRGVWPEKAGIDSKLLPASMSDGYRLASEVYHWARRKK